MAKHRRRGWSSRLVVALAAGLGLAALSYGGYAAVTWYRYGEAGDETEAGASDPLVDQFLPEYEVRERHETQVTA